MRVNIQDIATFSKCPRYSNLIKKNNEDFVVSAARKVMERCYKRRTSYFHIADWRVVLGWVDKVVFEKERVNVFDNNEFQKARKISEKIIIIIRNFYDKYYKKDLRDGFSCVPLEKQIGSHIIYGKASVMMVGEIPEIYILGNRSIDFLFRDIECRLYAWLICDLMKVTKVTIKYFYISPGYGTKEKKETFSLSHIKNIDKYAAQIAYSIEAGINYPSISEMCYHCPVKSRCII